MLMKHRRNYAPNNCRGYSEQPRDKCGIFAVYNCYGNYNATEIVFLGLQTLQHRGQESAGISYRTDGDIYSYKGMGLVNHCFSWKEMRSTANKTAMGHVRYSTSGASSITNVQPIVAQSADGYKIAVAHNGNLSNSSLLWKNYLEQGHIFQTESDTEIILAFLFQNRHKGLTQAVNDLMHLAEGAFSVVAMDNDEMVAFRDPRGFRPLCMGSFDKGYIFSSETCALDTVGASFLREIKPGEIVTARKGKIRSISGITRMESFCIFEYVYFSRADSNLNGINVHRARKNIGARLAQYVNTEIDMIIPSPDSGVSAAMGMAQSTGIPMEWAIHRNPYGGRTFINPGEDSRKMGAHLKYNPVTPLVKGKRVAVVDDSLVRGTTAREITMMLKKAGALSVHFFIAAPPYRFPCYYGIDIPLIKDLAVAATNPEELARSIGCESLTFNTLDDLLAGIGGDKSMFCSACFNGIYPVKSNGTEIIEG